MGKGDVKVEMEQRYCPTCRFDTQHAVLRQLSLSPRGQTEGEEELTSGCAICNPDRFWSLKLDSGVKREKFSSERWMPRIS